MTERTDRILADALASKVAHITAATLRRPEPPDAIRASSSAAAELTASQHATRRRWPVWTSAALIAAAIVVGAVVVGPGASERFSDRADAGDRLSAPTPTSVPFAVVAGSGYAVTGGSASNPEAFDSADTLLLAGRGNTYAVDGYQPHDGAINTMGSLPVRVNGRTGYVGCLEAAQPTTHQTCSVPELAWRQRPDAWAVITPTMKDSVSGLLRLAQSIDFTRTTSFAFPLRTMTAPPGAQLVSWRLQYPPHTVQSNSSSVNVTYRYPSRETVDVFLFEGAATSTNGRNRAVSVEGHRGWWGADGPDLQLDLGRHLFLQIVESDVRKLRTVLTLRDALSFAADIDVTSDLADRRTWFPIDEAFAPG